MVAAVAAKTVWKIRNVQFQLVVESVPKRANIVVPQKPFEAPNISPNPIAKNAMLPTEKSIRFFIRMLTAFLALVKPVSTIAKPACIKKTINAATHVQTILMFN